MGPTASGQLSSSSPNAHASIYGPLAGPLSLGFLELAGGTFVVAVSTEPPERARQLHLWLKRLRPARRRGYVLKVEASDVRGNARTSDLTIMVAAEAG